MTLSPLLAFDWHIMFNCKGGFTTRTNAIIIIVVSLSIDTIMMATQYFLN